jgi:peptide/nickel transport system permease protein
MSDLMNNSDELKILEEEQILSDSVKVLSPGRLVVRRFFRSRLSIVGLAI